MKQQAEVLRRALEALAEISGTELTSQLTSPTPQPSPSDSGDAGIEPTGMAAHDAGQWLPEFEAWAPQACVYRERCFGGVGALHVSFCEWCVRHRSVPCTRAVFERLLDSQGFLVCDALVSGLLLRSDLVEAMLKDVGPA
jgi:hypothetical protein